MGPACACAMRKREEKRDKEHGTWQIPSPSHMATAGGHSFFSYDYLFLTWGSLGFFYFTCLTLLYCTLPTYVRSPSFSEKQGRSDQVIVFLSRDKAKFERRNLVVGSWYCRDFRLPRCAHIHILSVFLSLSLFSFG